MLPPLEQWVCDVCKKPVDKDNGYVIWQHEPHDDKEFLEFGFKIVHSIECRHQPKYDGSLPLDTFLGDDGRSALLSFLSVGPLKKKRGDRGGCSVRDMDQFVDFFRRVQIPYYEEARKHFHDPDVLERYADSSETAPYLVESLKHLIEGVAEREATRRS